MQIQSITYPTALFLLREISNHFGLKGYTKLSNQIDEHISNPHYPHYFEDEFIKKLFTTQFFSSQIAQLLVHDTKCCIRDYYDFQKLFSLSGQMPSSSEIDFINVMISTKILPFIKQRLFELGLVPKNTKTKFLDAVFTSCKPVKKLDKEMQDRIRVWSISQELPDPDKLMEFSEACDYKKRNIILSSLLLARMIDSCIKSGILEKKINSALFDSYIRQELDNASASAYMHLSLHDLCYTSILGLPKDDFLLPEYKSSKKEILTRMYSKLPSLESQLQYSFEMIHQYLGTIESYQELINLGWAGLWAQARYQIYIGCLEESLDTYLACVDNCVRYDSRYLEEIVYEILITCSLQKKANNDYLRKIVNMAIRYGIRMPKLDINFDDLPKRFKLENVFEEWELIALKSKVYEVFEKKMFVAESCDYLDHLPKSSFIILENNVRIDLKNPNKKVNISTEQVFKMPQLHYCIAKRDVDAAKLLLESGANVNTLTDKGDSVLTLCLNDNIMELSTSQKEILDLLLQHNFTKETLNTVTKKKCLSTLHLAIELGNSELVENLITRGSNVNTIADIDQHTPLHLALKLLCRVQRPISFEQYVFQFMNYSPEQRQQAELSLYRHSGGQFKLNDVWQNIHTPHGRKIFQKVYELMQPKASEAELRKIIDIFLKAGANVNQIAKRPILGYTPLMLAVESNEYEIARYMVDHCNGDLNKTYIDPRDGRLISFQDIISEFKAFKCEALLS